jgi:hypothetical protein
MAKNDGSEAEAREIKERNKKAILEKPNVVGVGVGYKQVDDRRIGEVSLVVLVRRKVPPSALSPRTMVPSQVNGLPTDVIQVGEIRALQSRTDHIRPAPGGVSIGHYQITAGTLGYVVQDRNSGARFILSNNHVLANGNAASAGDPILQPGPYDGGTVARDTLARLERFIPIQYATQPSTCGIANAVAVFSNIAAILIGSHQRLEAFEVNQQATNRVDAALARPVNDQDVSDEILEIGRISGVVEAALGMGVRKSGRTTGLTMDTINIIHTTVNVSYGTNRTATFDDQIVAGPMSQGGDSGSLIVAADSQQAVGLLFAGSDQTTVFNPIQTVLDSLQVDLVVTQASRTNNLQSATTKAEAVRQRYEQELRSKANVIGVGVGYKHKAGLRTGDVGVVVMVNKKLPESELDPQDIIPSELEGVPVDVQEVGQIHAL